MSSPSTMNPVLQTLELGVQLGTHGFLSGVSLSIQPGSWWSVCGPNGAGKSTLLRALAGLQSHSGQILLMGREWNDMSTLARAQLMSWMGQAQPVPADLCVADVVRLGRWPHTAQLAADLQKESEVVAQCLHTMGLNSIAGRTLSQLSGGECQRVLLARAMAVQAPVMLFDEPLNHLDMPHQQAWLSWLRSRCRQGAAALTVMHELNQTLAADQILILRQGRVLHQGSPGDAATRQALQEAFEQSLEFHVLDTQGTEPRWVVLPRQNS